MSAIPVGLQIGVETTTIVSALAKTAMRIGGVLASDAVRNAGSDPRTEEQLVAILGRNRLDPAFSVHFRGITAPSAQEAISQFLKGLFLESGAGPTITQALVSDDPGLLSAVAHVSFLAWFHDAQSLAQAFTQAITDELVEAKAAPALGLNYIHLLGTIRACQQQTAAFIWEHYYVAVEHRINAGLQNMSSTNGRPRKRRKTSGTPRSGQSKPQPLSVSDRSVPYVVLRALIRSLENVQRFPEERVLQISCDQGISSIVVWCHYILGISVLVLVDDTAIPAPKTSHAVDGALQRRADVSWPSVLGLVYAFARVQNRGNCDLLPLSGQQFERIGTAEHGLSYERGFLGPVPDPVLCFKLLCRMLLGARYTDEYVSRAFLVSDRGWSVFLSSLEADDPEDLDCGVIYIKPGVPARDGVRKARLIDGMTDFGIDSTETVFFTKEPEEIAFWPGVWSAKLVGTGIGYDDDAFAVMQSYDWAHDSHGCRKWRLGFGEKQALCMDFWILKKCSCDIDPSEEAVESIDDLRGNTFTLRFPKEKSLAAKSPELVLQDGDIWLFFLGGDGAARWLGADGFRYLAGQETRTFAWYIRGRRCCVRCAVSFAKFPALILL
ncbi:hypothetical protein C8A01DRAFT_39383 [Parachaetomium inaequale]|uniref:Uncharacterized protein n=1 Tax=Parachaetomium inaequale TaxID=2588326 RepID=A0AAN6SNX4_9PEZI|nr:hypothetical protein C8A01DRAFT_39383 [Parachaetomium inaequale]